MSTNEKATLKHDCAIDKLHDYDDAARHLRVVTHRQLRRWVSEGRIGYCKIGGRVYFTTEQLDAYLQSRTFTPSK